MMVLGGLGRGKLSGLLYPIVPHIMFANYAGLAAFSISVR